MVKRYAGLCCNGIEVRIKSLTITKRLYKYGIDITNATLATYAYNLGITKSVSEMSQMEKQQLRVLSILQQSKVSWGDLANTISSPSNLIRQFKNNLAEAGMVLGQLFIPLMSSVMPVVNGVTIAIKRLLVSIAQLFGVKIDFESFGKSTVDIDDSIADSLDDVASSAEKAKKGIRAFDELDVIDTSSSTSKGGTGSTVDLTKEIMAATEEYEKAWNKAFEEMENTAQEWANKVEKILQPVKKLFGDISVGDWFAAGEDTYTLISGFFNWIAKAIDKISWYSLGKKVGKYLAGLNWTEILKSAANALWQGFKGALEFYVGMFTAAPLETIIASFTIMPKMLKAITATKFVTGISKLWKNFTLLGSGAEAALVALQGNTAAASALTFMFPNLTSVIDGIKNAFMSLGASIQSKGLWETLGKSISSVRNNLTGFQKSIIGIGSVAIEFTALKDAFYDITMGSESMLLSIGQIAGVSAAAAGAMYLAFGPAGVAIAGVTALVAAISGINKAVDEIETKEIGNSIKKALTNPGGTPISEIAGQYSDMVSKMSDNFSAITENSAKLGTADENIRSTWQEIEKIQVAMDSGVISVEEGTQRLTELFGELAQAASDKFTALENTLLTAFGENGVLSNVFERLGISTEDTISTVVTLNDKVNERIKELTAELATMDPSNPKYAQYREELVNLLATTDDFTAALNDFDLQLSQIDFSGIVLDDGTIDAEAFNKALEQIIESAKEAQDDITDAVKAVQDALQKEYDYAISIGDEESAEEIKTKMNALPDALTLLKKDVADKAKEFTDTVQSSLIEKTDEVIENAQKTWSEKNPFEKFLSTGGDSDKYVKKTIDKYNESLSEISSSIETSMSELGVKGAGWGSEAAKKITDSLFDAELYTNSFGEGAVSYKLNANYKSLIDDAVADIPGYVKKASKILGENSISGYVLGIKDNQSILNQTVDKSLKSGLEAGAAAIDSHSPSKKYKELGEFSVLGYNQGITDNTNLTIQTMQKYANQILIAFRNATITQFQSLGTQTMTGFLNGLSSMENAVYSKADDIAKNVAKTIQSALDIHSPSRVMFELGAYTTEGFKNGMESLFDATQLSVEDFGFDVVEAVHPPQLYGDYTNSMPVETSGTTQNYYNSNTSVDNAETNALLREQNQLLQRILAKEVGISTSDIGKASREYAKDYFNRTGRDAYSF